MSARTRLAQRGRELAAGADANVPSPCISVCRMDARTGLCEGCWRSLDEIAAWAQLDDNEKRRVWARIAQRIEEQQA